MKHSASAVPYNRAICHLMFFLVAISVLLAVPGMALSQTAATAVISGLVTDPQGAVIPGAEVELLNLGTNQRQVRMTNADGQYTFPRVSPGEYKITVTMQGFRQAVLPSVKIEVAKSYSFDFTLEVGEMVETVEVTAGAVVELQKTDATVGNVISSEPLLRLPTLTRQANELLTLQPGVMPTTGFLTGGAVTGARSDQSTFSLDGIDISDNVVGGGAALNTVIPVPVDSVEEFRVGVTNPNATFGRSAGAQVAFVSRRGSNEFHGAAYWYHQNDNLNANSWTNNRNRIPKPELKDNRFGFRFGGPFWRNKTFFHVNYEGRRFPSSVNVTRIVPSETLRRGILRFRDNAGNIVSYDLATSTLCGENNDQPCDPRGLGLSPSVAAFMSLYPQGNDPTLGDGLNTIGFRSTASVPIETNYVKFHLTHNFTDKWQFTGSYAYFRNLRPTATQIDIRGGFAEAVRTVADRPQSVTASLVGQITPTLTSSFRFGWVRDRTDVVAFDPSAVANLLATPGTNTAAGHVAINLAGDGGFLQEPIDVDTQRARTQGILDHSYQFTEDVTWIKGNHTLQFGSTIRYLPTFHNRNDKVVGSLTSLVAALDAGRFVSIPASARPPTCSEPGQANCISQFDVTRWNRLYALTLGLVDNVNILAVRDGDLNPLPLGTQLIADTTLWAYEFYAQDTWRVTPSLTLTYGLSYQWQTPPKEKLGRQTFVINNETGEILTSTSYLEAKREAALRGDVFNPELAYMPINSSGRNDIFDIDWNNVGPRVAVAWNPSFTDGLGGWLFGDRKTVLRGGFGVVYDRLNTVQSVIIPMLGVGFAQTLSVNGPNCDATNAPGPGCDPSGPDPMSAFRVGVDGTLPLPSFPEVSAPVVPGLVFSELLSFQVDPDFKVGTNYSIDFTIQRELPGNMLFEIGWAARFGRDLPQSKNLNSAPFFHVDPASGQSFAEAFDAIATELRAGADPANVTPQPWFENQLPGLGTAWAASNFTSEFIDGLLSDLFLSMNLTRAFGLGLPSFNNLQVLELFQRTSGGRSNYHGLLVTLRKRMSRGLTFDLNYTFSKSLDQVGAVQNSASYFSSSFFPDLEYGPSFFDRTHVFNAHWLYELPAGRGHLISTGNWFDKFLGGWYVSGIFRAFSGVPLIVSQGDQVFGGGIIFAFNSGAIPLRDPSEFSNSTHSPVSGSNGVGTNGDPANGGSGINMFSNPEAVFNSFRKILLSKDGRTGRANPLRGFPRWNLDMSLGKKTTVAENVNIVFSFDFFNIFNHVDFNNPSLSLLNPRAFGVVTSQFIQPNRTEGSRWIQFGFRVEF